MYIVLYRFIPNVYNYVEILKTDILFVKTQKGKNIK